MTITLLDAGNAVVGTTTTAAGGTYSFPPQPAGSYTVVETQPAGYQSGPQNAGDSVAFALVAGTPATVDFGESAGSLAGTVFLDANNNGVQDGGEIGLPGVTVALTGTAADGSTVNTSSITNGTGQYLFNDLLSGTYTITETQPGAFGDGLDVLGAGNVGGTAANDVYWAIALPVGTQATGYNFSESGAAVVGVVYRDLNRDGTQQGGDVGIANVTVTLRDAGNTTTIATTTTAADGSFLFAGISAGNYVVVESQPAGYGSSPSSPDTLPIVIPPGGGTTAAFADTLSTLAGSVYVDLDNDGVRDAGEPGLSGISIQLTGTDAAAQAVNRTATTDSTGAFLFIDLLTPNGAGYTVRRAGAAAGVHRRSGCCRHCRWRGRQRCRERDPSWLQHGCDGLYVRRTRHEHHWRRLQGRQRERHARGRRYRHCRRHHHSERCAGRCRRHHDDSCRRKLWILSACRRRAIRSKRRSRPAMRAARRTFTLSPFLQVARLRSISARRRRASRAPCGPTRTTTGNVMLASRASAVCPSS